MRYEYKVFTLDESRINQFAAEGYRVIQVTAPNSASPYDSVRIIMEREVPQAELTIAGRSHVEI